MHKPSPSNFTHYLKFLKPKITNVVATVVILSLPLLKERVPLPEGGFVVEKYIPFHLLFAYLQMGDYFPFIQMVGFSLFVYLAVSASYAILSKLIKIIINQSKK